MVPHDNPDLNAAVMDALDALRRGRERGGNQIVTVDRADNDTRVKAYDQVWVKHIKAALMENRFRLVQQPIAALAGGDAEDVRRAIRMLDAQGKEVLPSEFLPAAERNDLLKNIDRWVHRRLAVVRRQAQTRSAVRAPVARQRARPIAAAVAGAAAALHAGRRAAAVPADHRGSSRHAPEQTLRSWSARCAPAACGSRSSTSAPAAIRRG